MNENNIRRDDEYIPRNRASSGSRLREAERDKSSNPLSRLQ